MNGRRASDSHPITGLIPNWKKPETSGIPGQREWKRPSSTSVQQQSGLRKMRLGMLSDGTKVVARPGSKTGGATLEIKVSNSKIYKIRY